ncbi:type VI secretion system membrane subunit TssM [Reinekea marinisedimentorum]|uniref:Type VI secretion system protein ImpL n=1 Tax=Reinekea marinisedimentorum TaxID=230495 RepID=A0A4V2UJT1_9GAMM|nr:type VI secretion system membrane subunit TssM [Reinekea marinisedimentorum]TCS41291.1 type VI secretion system protein ImpL [Reinekea marinisedimentorum]
MKTLLMRLVSFLARAATGIAAGVLAVAIIIWFGGRYVGLISVQSRLIAIGVLLAVFVLWLIAKFVFFRIRGKKLAEGLASGTDDDQLKEKLEGALKSLKSTDLGRRFKGRGALYALPWYMIIGPSGAGKSTFYSRSGLNFPFKDDERYHLSGIGGTKNCDWWFSDQAVLIDTAGRYSSQEGGDEWIHFLQLLKKNRPRVPVNGVILALPIDELLTGDSETLKSHAHNTRNRLQEVMVELGLMVPVYIVLTKCDMVRGFDAFFEDLSDSEAAQPWGVYVLDQTEDKRADVVQVFKEKIDALNDRLLEQRTQKMILARSSEQRADIYQYPSQFAGVSERLIEFIELLFKDSPYHEKPWFAGVYFTSSVQEGEVIERKNNLLKDIFSKALGLTYRSKEHNRSYFIEDFFTKVIFPLKNAVRGSRSSQRFHLAAKSFSLIGMLGVILAVGLALGGTYTANMKLLGDYEKKAGTLVERLQSTESTQEEQFQALVGLYGHYKDLEKISTYSPLSLFSSYDLIGTHGEPMRNLLVATLERTMEHQVAPRLKTNLSDMSTRWQEIPDEERNILRLSYYRMLETYLMMTSRPDKYVRDHIAKNIAQVWFESFPKENMTLSYDAHYPVLVDLSKLYLQYAFEDVDINAANPWDAGSEIVGVAQAQMGTEPNADNLYMQLVSGAAGQYDEVSLISLVGEESKNVLLSPVVFSGIYTVNAWHDYVNSEIKRLTTVAADGDWVLGMNSVADDPEVVTTLAKKLERDVRQLYFTDYSDNWIDLVSQTRSFNTTDLAKSIQIVKDISASDGLLVKLFAQVKANLAITEIKPLAAITSDDADDDAEQQVEALPVINPVISAFAAMTKDLSLIVTDNDDSGLADFLEAYLVQIQPLADELDTIKVASDIDLEARRYAGDVLSGNADNKQLYTSWINVSNLLEGQSDSVKGLTSAMITSPLRTVWSGMIKASQRSLESLWLDNVYKTYSASLRGRFPFSEDGVDATVRDVSAFLTPSKGQLWSFVNNELKPFVQVRSGNWKVRTWLGEGLNFNRQLFSGVNSASQVVNGLFDDQNLVSMRYWVIPIPSPGVSESLFEVDSSSYRYRNEPEQWKEFNWSLESSQFAQVEAHLNHGGGYADMTFDGPWAFLKLLSKSEVSHDNDTQFYVTLPVSFEDGRLVNLSYKIRADRAGSVLNKSMLTNFYLPKDLFKG